MPESRETDRRWWMRRRIVRHLWAGGMLCQIGCEDGHRCQLPEGHAAHHTHEYFGADEVVVVPAPDREKGQPDE